MAYALLRPMVPFFLFLAALAVSFWSGPAWSGDVWHGAIPAQPLGVPLALAGVLPPCASWLLVLLAGAGLSAWGLGEATDRMRPAR